jgi:hypothetical protein
MRNVILPCILAVILLSGAITTLWAQPGNGKQNPGKVVVADKDNGHIEKPGVKSERLNLKTQTLVSKKLDHVDKKANGKKVYHYTYRVEAVPSETDLPQYVTDPQYNVSFEQEGFQAEDSVTLLSDNEESATDSPVWVYDVAYVESGVRSLSFATTGSVMAAAFSAASGELDPNDPDYHCGTCSHSYISQCTAACRCCCYTGDENCNCSGCQYQTPRCFSCPVDCTCEHCVCSCDGCLTQNPRCLVCPVGCTCGHCTCLCLEDVDHEGRCGCVFCKQRPLTCECECHCVCP